MEHTGKRPNVPLMDALEESLRAMQQGASIEACLQRYAEQAEELRPLLQAAQMAQSLRVEEIPAAALNRSRTRVLGRAAQLRKKSTRGWFARLPRLAFNLAAVVIVLVVGLFSLNSASAQALPGDTLYPLKLSIENLWLRTAASPQARQNLETAFQQRRIEEVRQLLTLGREENVQFQGVLVKQQTVSGTTTQRWTVSDIEVTLSAETEVVGEIKIGMLVEVQGVTQPGQGVLASVVRPRAYAFIGVVEQIAATSWQIGGQQGFGVLPFRVPDQPSALVFVVEAPFRAVMWIGHPPGI